MTWRLGMTFDTFEGGISPVQLYNQWVIGDVARSHRAGVVDAARVIRLLGVSKQTRSLVAANLRPDDMIAFESFAKFTRWAFDGSTVTVRAHARTLVLDCRRYVSAQLRSVPRMCSRRLPSVAKIVFLLPLGQPILPAWTGEPGESTRRNRAGVNVELIYLGV